MDDKKPLLSICIPTYNRSEYLDICLASIVSQKEFNSEDLELVISDNASIDNTEEIVKKYQRKHKNIFYSKNKENIRDKNFPLVINSAHGIFRKLCNDTLIFEDNSIQYLLNLINENIDKRPILFFMSCSNKKMHKDKYIVDNFNSFVKIASFWLTWIGGFGIWEDDFKEIEDKFSGCELSLWQTKILLEIVSRKGGGIIDNKQLFINQAVQKKDLSYGLYNVFYKNYLELYQQYLTKQVLLKKTFFYLRKHLLFNFFISWIIVFHFDSNKYMISLDENIEKLILNAYHNDLYFLHFYVKLKILILKRNIRKYIKNKIL